MKVLLFATVVLTVRTFLVWLEDDDDFFADEDFFEDDFDWNLSGGTTP